MFGRRTSPDFPPDKKEPKFIPSPEGERVDEEVGKNKERLTEYQRMRAWYNAQPKEQPQPGPNPDNPVLEDGVYDASRWTGRTETEPPAFSHHSPAKWRETLGTLIAQIQAMPGHRLEEANAVHKRYQETHEQGVSERQKKRASEKTLAEKASIHTEYDAARKAEEAYRDALATFYKNNSYLERNAKLHRAVPDTEVAELRRREDEMKKAFIAETNAAITSAEKRFDEWRERKTAQNPNIQASALDKEKFMARYRGMVRATELGVRMQEAKTEARREGLDVKGKAVYEKAFMYMARTAGSGMDALKKRYGAEKVAKIAKAARLVSAATLSTALFGGVSGLGFAGSALVKLGRSLLGITAGATAGQASGKIYEKWLGKGASAKMNVLGRAGNVFSDADFDAFAKAFKKGNSSAVARKKKLVETGTAFLVGGAVGAGAQEATGFWSTPVAQLESVQEAGLVLQSSPGSTSVISDFEPDNAPVKFHPEVRPGPIAIETPEDLPVTTENSLDRETFLEESPEPIDSPVAEAVQVTAERGDGAIKMFEHLREELLAKYPDFDQAPSEVKEFLSLDSEALAMKYGFYNPGTAQESAIIALGSTLELRPDGSLVFTAPNAEATILGHGTEGVADVLSTPNPDIEDAPRPAPQAETAPRLTPEGDILETQRLNLEQLERARAGRPEVGLPQSDTSTSVTSPSEVVEPSTTSVESFSERLESLRSPVAARAFIDAEISQRGISPDLIAELTKAAPDMTPDPTLFRYIEPGDGTVPGPTVFLGSDGRFTVYGAAADGENYPAQVTIAGKFAAESGQPVNVLLPDGARGHLVVFPDGTVKEETGGFLRSYNPPQPINQSVYAFRREDVT